MNHAQGQEAREAAPAEGFGLEGRLRSEGGRAGIRLGRPPDSPRERAYRLKRSLQLFSASDGALYLLRSGAHADFVLEEPSSADRLILEVLSQGFASEGELRELLASCGESPKKLADALGDLEGMGLLDRAPDRRMFSPRDAERFDRQLIYLSDIAPPGLTGEDLQERLRRATVALLGCGGLGCCAASALAGSGIGAMVLIDDDRVELSNLNRQILFTENDLGRLKVEAASEALRAHNSTLEVKPLVRRVGGPEDLSDALKGVDLLIATADSPPYQLARWVNESCLAQGVPYIGAGQFPPLIRVGPLVVPGLTACLECVERATRHDFPLYDELTAAWASGSVPDASLGPASGLIGSLLAMEAIHLLSGACRPATVDSAAIFDLRTFQVEREQVKRDPGCPQCSSLTSVVNGALAGVSSEQQPPAAARARAGQERPGSPA